MLSRLRIGTKIGASFALGLGIFSIIALIAYQGIQRLIETSRLEAHTYQVLGQLKNLEAQMNGAESGQRGYIITGRPEYLSPYNRALGNVDNTLEELRRLTEDNPVQQKRLNDLEPLIQERIDVMQGRIDARRDRGFEASQREIRQGVGFELSNQIFALITEMATEEQALLEQRNQAAQKAVRVTMNSLLLGVPLYSILLASIAFLLTRSISRPLNQIAQGTERVSAGDLSTRLPDTNRQDEVGVLTRSFNQMIASLQATTTKNNEQGWLKSSLAEVTQKLQGQRDLTAVARLLLAELAPRVGAQHGVFYLLDAETDPPVLKLVGSYAYQERKQLNNQFQLGEGLVGQCALEKQRILLTTPADYIRITSGLGEAAPLNVVVLPVLFEGEVAAVLELASLQPFREIHLTLLDQVSVGIGVILKTIAADLRTNQLLEQSRRLALELQERQIALEASNQQLEHQTLELRRSEALLREQQEELQQTNEELQQLNEELEEKAELLTLQKQEVEAKNQALETARQTLAEQTEQLSLVSKYKSEFLANMSHELRTPLNSLLILARLLSENSDGNLTQKQVEYSRTIYSAGNDLLSLINDILDLAKIESGTISLEPEPIALSDLMGELERTFRQVATEKGLQFVIQPAEDLPASFTTDSKRLQQILKNLLANAFKFTERGSVTLRIEQRQTDPLLKSAGLPSLVFAVRALALRQNTRK
jgi:CHASE3 domain sensor protein/signal transduction histidine kinase